MSEGGPDSDPMANSSSKCSGRSAVLATGLCALAAVAPVAADAGTPSGVDQPAAGARPLGLPLPADRNALAASSLPVVRALPGLLAPIPLPATGTPLDGVLKGGAPQGGGGAGAPVPDGSAASEPPVRLRRLKPVSLTPRPAPESAADVARREETIPPSKAAAGGEPIAAAAPRARNAPAARAPSPPKGRIVLGSADRAASRPLDAIRWGGARGLREAVPEWSRPIIAVLLLLALALGLRSLLTGARARRLEEQRKLLTDDVGVLQRALVPEIPQRLGDLWISAAYCPAEGPGAGGDFYDAFPLHDGRVGVILGDVAGHGRSALERAALARYTVRAYVEAGLEPRAALKLAGTVLGEDPQAPFVTVAVAVFDAPAGVLTYSLAGHHPPLLLGAGIREPLSVCSSPPLGVGLPTGLRQTTVSLSSDAVACFFTDGLIEARVGDGMLGRENLERRLLMLGPGPDAGGLLSQAGETATDDRAVCIVRVGTAAGRALHLEELELDARDAGGGDVARFLGECGVTPDEINRAIGAALAAPAGTAVLMRVWLDERGASVRAETVDPDRFESTRPQAAAPLI